MSALRGILMGYGTAAIKDKESKDNARMEVVKAAGLNYYTNELPQFQKTEAKRADEYNMIAKLLDSEEAADLFDKNGFITGDGKSVERVQAYLENKNIKKDSFKNYIPTENYADRFNTRKQNLESRYELIAKNLTMQQGGIGPSTVAGLITKPEGDITKTETVTTPGVEPQQIPGTPIMTSGTPEKTEEITTTVPRTTADTAMSEFFVSKAGVLNIGKENDIANASSSFRGFGEGMSKDNLGNVIFNFMGNKATEYNAFKSVMNDVAQQYETEDGKVSLSLAAQAADEKLTVQTQGIIGLNEVSMVDGYTKGTIKGAESYTATGFSADFENSFEGNTKREKILTYISTLGTKSEMQYFAMSFPSNLKFDDGVNIRQYLITVTQ